MLVENKTHYFSEYTKLYNCLPDPDSFSVQSSKRMGYFQRLWFEYAYCRKVNGKCFYYTLTYNDGSIPMYRGRPCFSYDDIRYVTNGSLSKTLLRKYGSVLRYFCACETGEGKGKRGLGNNPHYHFIFYVEPADNPKYPYVPITAQEFKDLIYNIWQGSPSNVFVPWQLAKFGHVQEGLYNGEVLSPDAFKYVGKYVVKDSEEMLYEKSLKRELESEIRLSSFDNRCLYYYYKYIRFVQNDISGRSEFFDYFYLHHYWLYRSDLKKRGLPYCSYKDFLFHHGLAGISKIDLFSQWFDNWYVPQYLEELMSDYRNKYSPKARLSKTLGQYGLNFIVLQNGCPRVVLNTSKGYEVQYPCLYYIRRLFYDVRICPVTGNPLYYLNEYGIKLKLCSLETNLSVFQNSTREHIAYAFHNNVGLPLGDSPDCYNKLFNQFLSLSDYPDLYNEIIRRYSVYHTVYQYRCFSDDYHFLTEDCKPEDYKLDYGLFLHQNSYYLDFQKGKIFDLITHKVMLSFSSHPAFIQFINYFKMLDVLNEVVTSQLSYARKTEFSRKSKHMKRLNAYRYSSTLEFPDVVLPKDVPSAPDNTYPLYHQLSLFA